MKKKVVAYLSGVPNAKKSPHKIEVLNRFIEGVNRCGDIGISNTSPQLIESDVGVIQGWVHDSSPNSPHLRVRKSVADNTKNKHTIIVDSNLFNYTKVDNPHYSRYSMDGIFPTTGNYFNNEVDPSRWKQISSDIGLSLKDWRTKGNYILLCTQRNGGWSMKGLDVVSWIEQTVAEIRKYTDRTIIIRGHPGDKMAGQYLNRKGWLVSKNEKIVQDFNNAWAVVTYNSSPGVAAAIEGRPVFVTDSNPRVSQAFDVANTDLSQIENPTMFDRQQWVEKLAMCHWKFEELSNGSAWAHMRNYA